MSVNVVKKVASKNQWVAYDILTTGYRFVNQ